MSRFVRSPAPCQQLKQNEEMRHQLSEERLVTLIANGEAPFPSDLPASKTAALAADVRRLRRQRLVRFVAQLIARSIARDLHHTAGP